MQRAELTRTRVALWEGGAPDDGVVRELPGIGPGNRTRSQAVRAIAGRQAGIVARAQLLSAGISNSVVARAVGSGRLHRIHPGVYAAVAPELLTEEGQLLAALLAAGDGALLSHATAAWRWRIIPAPPSVMQLAVPQPRTAPAGLVFHESGRLRADDVTTNAGFPTTGVPRTLLDLATRYEHRALLRALAEAEFHHDLRPADIVRTLRRGHPGSANLRAALKAHAPGYGDMKSQLERCFRRLLIAQRTGRRFGYAAY